MFSIIAPTRQDRIGEQLPEPEASGRLMVRDASEPVGNGAQEFDYRDDPLYVRLQSFEFDTPGISFPFSARLARDCMWTLQHAERVCEEYRKFLFLCCVADHVVTPSDDVDQAWHLHLTYTQSYWDDLCINVLGMPLHHTPTEGGEEQGEFYRDCYSKTLQSYRSAFGEDPPPDIWPDVTARFDSVGTRDASIRSNLEPLVANALTIADSEVDQQNREGKVDNLSANQVHQLNARLRFEDFARAQDVGLVIVADKAVDFATGLDDSDAGLIAEAGGKKEVKRITTSSGREYYVSSAFFAPWRWRVYLAKDARNFDSLISQVNAIYAGSALVMVAITGFLLAWLRQFLVRPIYDIARQFSEGHAPRYRGVKELEYLSTSIRSTLKSLRAKTLHLETALQSMSDAITVFDADMRLVAWNRQFGDLYRYPDGFIHTGMRFADIMSYNIARGDYGTGNPDEQLTEIVERARTLSPSRFDVDRADGTSVEVRRARMPDGGFVTTYRDITDRKQRLRFEAANEAKAQFLQNMSHDLRKPIAAIIEDARLTLADPHFAQATDLLKVFQAVNSNASHLLSMIDELLEMSRIEAGQIEVRPQQVTIAPVLDQILRVVEPSARAKKLDIRVVTDQALEIKSDQRLLSRIILNLASNAVEYTKTGTVLISARANGTQLLVDVADTGIGIAADRLSIIFEKFQQITPTAGLTRPGVGLGLGLAISREFARLLGGDIKVSSEIGKGSVFTLTLPISTEFSS